LLFIHKSFAYLNYLCRILLFSRAKYPLVDGIIYDCERHAYFMSTNTQALLEMREELPEASYCQGAGQGNAAMVDTAIAHGFDKVQFVDWHPLDQDMIDRCHAQGIRCNYCASDEPAQAQKLLDMGIDCLLVNDFHTVKSGLPQFN